MFSVPRAAGEGGAEFHFEVDEQRAGSVQQEHARVFALDGPAAEGQHNSFCSDQAGDGRMFAVTEGSFAVAGEDVGDSGAGFGLDHVVHIDEVPAEARCDQRTDGGFARAHEAGENDAARWRSWTGWIL